MRWVGLVFSVVAMAAPPAGDAACEPAGSARLGVCAGPPAEFNVERRQVASSAELLTVFGSLPGSKAASVPLLSVLRDTLGDDDPSNDRLRYVWVLMSASPTLLQRAAAALPFFYFRPNLGKNADHAPSATVDLGATGRGVWTALAGSLVQSVALDSNGSILRSTTRSYRTNLQDARSVRLSEGLTGIALLEQQPAEAVPFTPAELLEIQARLTLVRKPLGGLVDSQRLPAAYIKQRTRSEEMRGHNWELLRQRAEANGLYFTPLGPGRSATHALLWVARRDLADGSKDGSKDGGKHPFDGHFLQIADPFTDSRLKNWTGYSFHDPELGDMLPLALYGLEYPKVPLLLVDYRRSHAPKSREMLSRAAVDAVSGVLGISKIGNWPWFAGAWALDFVRTRHGEASNRPARLRAFVEVRELVALDPALDTELRTDLLKRLEVMGVNPLETSVFAQAGIAQRQYQALLRYADDPKGLGARLERDRNVELMAAHHGIGARTGLQLAHIATLGAYSHRETPPEALLEALDAARQRKSSGVAQSAQSKVQSVFTPSPQGTADTSGTAQ